MASTFYIQDAAKSVTVYPDTDPLPIPSLDPPKSVVKGKAIRANVDGTITSGASTFYDLGTDVSDMVIELNFFRVTTANRTALRTIYNANSYCYFYHAVEARKFKCIMESLVFPVYDGTTAVLSCHIRLLVIAEVSAV